MSNAGERNDGDILRFASKLSDVRESFKWYSLQIPALANIQPRVGHAIVSLKDGQILMIGGGNHAGALNEVYSIELEPDRINDTEQTAVIHQHPASGQFPPRYEFLCAKESEKACAWVFGGADTENTTNEVIKIDDKTIVETIKSTSGKAPSPRTQGNNSAFVEYQGKNYIAIFAGGLKGERPVQDCGLYLFDTLESKWQEISIKSDSALSNHFPFACQPPLVQGHVMTAVGSKILVHGGINNTTLYDGFHCLDFTKEHDHTFSWIDCSVIGTSSVKPSGRAAHGIARVADVDKSSPVIYIFGGIGEKGACNDLWSFNMDSMSWTQITKGHGKDNVPSNAEPSPRLDFAMCVVGLPNSASERQTVYIMIHGGMNREGEIFNDAWLMRIQ